VRALRQTVPLGAGETPASFVARLAARNGPSARDFCLDFGTQFQKVVDGDPGALTIVAGKGGIDPAALAAHTFIHVDKHRYLHRGEELVRNGLRRSAVAVCPCCLADDIAAGPSLQPHVAAFGRAIWQIAAVKDCPVHQTPLVIAIKDVTPSKMHDWTQHVANVIPDLPRMLAEAVQRQLTGLETYVVERIAQGPTGGLLDTFPLHAAIGACELFGAVATLGRTPDLKKMTDDEWRAAGGAGYDIFASGSDGVTEFLLQLQQSYPYSGGATEGAQAIFGRIYQVLEFGREDASYDGLRHLVGDFIRTRFPVGPGDLVFGKPVEKRLLHSIRTLSIETGLHPKRLRKVLKAAGVLPANGDALADGNCLFDAERGSLPATEASAATLSVRKAGEYLNAPRVQRDRLYQHGMIVPRIRAGDHGAADKFAPEDLDAFLARLLDGAVPVDVAADGQVNVPEAAKAGFIMSEDLVRLILDGKLVRKWLLTSERGYMSLLLDVEEVRALVRGPDHGGLTGLQIKDRLSTTAAVAAALIKHGHLPAVTVINPINRCPIVVVMPDQVDRFDAEYVSLFAIARKRGLHHMVVKKALTAAGVQPALDPRVIGATFYRRSGIRAARIPTNRKENSR
jgi:hypothetical protein